MRNDAEILTRGVINIIPSKKKLLQTLSSSKKLNVYLGIDPTNTKIHLGHTVPLRKLQAFAEMGHNAIFLIGDFTALIGDTSDKDSERPILTKEEIRKNFQTYKRQASKVLDFSKVKLVYNSSWLKKLDFEKIIKLAQNFSLGDFINRELIKKRLETSKRVRLDETLYPVMQAYDSYFLDTDIQIGAADQTFNMQAGRILQKKLRGKESFIIVTDYLMGTDGRKMSKSLGNAIWIEDKPEEMFGKIMSIDDKFIASYFELLTSVNLEEIRKIEKEISKGVNPMDFKKRLAFEIVEQFHGKEKATWAKRFFEKTFQMKTPEYKKVFTIGKNLAETIANSVPHLSISKAKKLILEGGVDINGETVKNPFFKPQPGQKIKVGRKIFGILKK